MYFYMYLYLHLYLASDSHHHIYHHHHHHYHHHHHQNDHDDPQGDSGGPFTVKNSETLKHDLVGVVSWGDGCAAVRIQSY